MSLRSVVLMCIIRRAYCTALLQPHGRLLIDNGCTAAYPCNTGTGTCWPYHCDTHCSQSTCDTCSNTCADSSDGWCDDGGEGAQHSLCFKGTDCEDCGTRTFGSSSTSAPTPSPNSAPTPSPNSAPTPSPNSAPGGGSQVDHICDIVNPSLVAIPQCSCTETTGGTGLVTECQESIAAGSIQVGVRVQLEPCGNPAFAELTYQFGSTSWEPAGRIAADGSPLLYAIPGAAYLGAGLFISVTVTGNAADLSVHARLSACLNGVCDGEILIIGSGLTAVGFPLPLLEFDDLAFVDSCPAEASSSSNTIIIVAAAAGGVAVIVLLGVGFWYYKEKKAAEKKAAHTQPTSTKVSSTRV